MSRLLLIALLALTLVAAACGDDDGAEATRPGEPAAAVREVESGAAALLDVRTLTEYQGRHAADAEHVPLDDLEQGDRPDVAKDARIYVYCRTGRRAAEAVALLRADGWRDVRNVGGLDDWERLGGEIAP